LAVEVVMSAYWELIRDRPGFRQLWLGEIVSQLGDWLSWVAVSLLALEHGGGEGAMAVALVLAAHSLPQALLAPVGGVLADRWDRRNLLIGVHLTQALLTGLMLLSALSGAIVVLTALVAARSALTALDWPARTGALRRLVDDEELLTANALSASTWSAMFALGMAGGGLLAMLGPEIALAVDTATFLLGAALLLPLPAMPTKGSARLTDAVGELRTAVAMLADDRRLLRAVAAKLPMAVAGGGALVLLNLVAAEAAFAGAAGLTLGLLQGTKGIGTGIGPVLAKSALDRGYSLDRVWSVVMWGGLGGMAVFAASGSAV